MSDHLDVDILRPPGSRQLAGPMPALDSERKHVTILFADVKGSLELLADRDPEEASRLLDAVLTLMMDAVHRYGGTVNHALGDGIMAIFGAPVAHEDHALRACHAALGMQAAIARHAAETGRDVGVRIGINSGEVVVRSISSDLFIDYSAVGRTTHLAGRMEQMAAPGAILLTGSTLRLAEGGVEVQALGPSPVKGLAEPVEIYSLLGVGRRTRLGGESRRGLTPFAGRREEMQALERTVALAAAGCGQIVGVVGQPGVGKSRLVLEFVGSARLDGWLVLQGSAAPYGVGFAHRPVIELLRDYYRILPGDDAVATRDKVLAPSRHPGAPGDVAPILALLDAGMADPAWDRLDSDQRRRRTIEALCDLLVSRTKVQPVCLVIEDLHWADQETQALLDSIAARLPAIPLLFLATYRPEYQHRWRKRRFYTELRVDPLPPPEAHTVLSAILGDGPDLAPLKAGLVERTGGNPFFLEESVRHLEESGIVVGERGAYRVAGEAPAAATPETVHAVLQARIDRLSREDKRLLQAAATIGRVVPHALLQAIADLPEAALRRGLARLQAAEFLHEVRSVPDAEYAFGHALMADVACASLLRDRRRALDARIVAALEADGVARRAEHLDRLAHHAVRGEVWDRAFAYCREAGALAFGRSAHRTAAACFEQALAALERCPGLTGWVQHAIDLRLELRYALSPLGEYQKMVEHLTEAARLATGAGDDRRLGLVSAFLTNLFTVRGEFARAVEHGARALSIAEAQGDRVLAVVANAFLVLTHYGRGDYRRAVDLAEVTLGLLEGESARERFGMTLYPAVYARAVMAWSLAELGEFSRALDAGEEGVRLGESLDHPQSLVFALLGVGYVMVRRGEHAGAIGVLERAREVCRATDLPEKLIELAMPLATAYARSGRAPEAIALLDTAVAMAIRLQHRYGFVLRSGGLGEAYLCAGRAAEAMPLAQAWVGLTRAIEARGSHAWALRLSAEVAMHLDPAPLEQARAALDEALAVARELGMRPLEGRCHFLLGLLDRRLGLPAEAEAALTRGRAIFRELGMAEDLRGTGAVAP
jgi:class 3 adenylate cyclase/tetratricopeptide (TPR) repeat protein